MLQLSIPNPLKKSIALIISLSHTHTPNQISFPSLISDGCLPMEGLLLLLVVFIVNISYHPLQLDTEKTVKRKQTVLMITTDVITMTPFEKLRC
jgi:hypothetical protein